MQTPRRPAFPFSLALVAAICGCASQRARPAEAHGGSGADPIRAPPTPSATPDGLSERGSVQRGWASFYSRHLNGRRTANGERYDGREMTAAHRSLPFGSWVEVRRRSDGRRVVVRINDRGPYVRGRIIDLSHRAAETLGILKEGRVEVEIRLLGRTADATR